MTERQQCDAIIPAAGRSSRMGGPHKLLLPWQGRPVIAAVLDAWAASRVDRIWIVVREDDSELIAACRHHSRVEMLVPDADPPDMKASVQFALRRIETEIGTTERDRWLLAPADLPTLTSQLIDRVLQVGRRSNAIVAPRFGGRPGHPVSFPWRFFTEVFSLPSDRGINRLLRDHEPDWIDLPLDQRPADIDTPEDYRRLADGQTPSP